MKRAAIPLILLVSGFVLGLLCSVSLRHPAAATPAAVIQKEETPSESAVNTTSLLHTAAAVTNALHDQDYETLSTYVHPTRGVTFTPYSTVDLQRDQNFTADQIKNLSSDTSTYTWGYEDGRGESIQMTMSEYFTRFVFDADYTQAPKVGVDQIITSGNALENLTEAYPDCHFVDFCYPSRDPANEGLDWCSLKLVFLGEKPPGIWWVWSTESGPSDAPKIILQPKTAFILEREACRYCENHHYRHRKSRFFSGGAAFERKA